MKLLMSWGGLPPRAHCVTYEWPLMLCFPHAGEYLGGGLVISSIWQMGLGFSLVR